jgi:hypothetical protein
MKRTRIVKKQLSVNVAVIDKEIEDEDDIMQPPVAKTLN